MVGILYIQIFLLASSWLPSLLLLATNHFVLSPSSISSVYNESPCIVIVGSALSAGVDDVDDRINTYLHNHSAA